MKELSVFVDESGDLGSESKYYLLALVFHNQDESLAPLITQYEQVLATRQLENIPLHLNPLLRGNERYINMAPGHRMRLLTAFSTFAHKLPFRYHVFAYQKDQFPSTEALGAHMRRDLVEYLFDHLAWFQAFDLVKIYYDDGQPLVTSSLHRAFEYALAKRALVYREAQPEGYRMLQLADYVCGIELAARRYDCCEESATDHLFFGTRRDFTRTFLRKLRKHEL